MSEWTKVGERPTEEGFWVREDELGDIHVGHVVTREDKWLYWNNYPVRHECFDTARWCKAEYPYPPPRKDVFDEIAEEFYGGKSFFTKVTLAEHLRKNADRILEAK